MTVLKDISGNPHSATNPVPIGGNVAHDGVSSGNPLRVGAKAINVSPTAVSATNDVTDIYATMHGALVTRPYGIPEVEWLFACAAPITGTTDTVVKAAGATGIRNYITGIQFINTSATATEIVLKDGATVIWRGFAPASMTSMVNINFNNPLRGTAVTAVNFAAITTAANIYVNAQGFTAV